MFGDREAPFVGSTGVHPRRLELLQENKMVLSKLFGMLRKKYVGFVERNERGGMSAAFVRNAIAHNENAGVRRK